MVRTAMGIPVKRRSSRPMDPETTTIGQLKDYEGQAVRIRGWLYNTRRSGKIMFLLVRDGTGICQCVVERTDQNQAIFKVAKGLSQESSVELVGLVRLEQRAVGGVELSLSEVRVVGESHDYPITPKAHGVDFLMRRRHLWLRSRRQHAILRVRAGVVAAIRNFFDDRGFVLIDTPIISPPIGEEAATLFEVDYFGEPAYLAQTGQLYLEAACMSLGKVYCFGPTFRAEKSKTRRHLAEFWMVEPEVAFAELDEVMELAEGLVGAIVERVVADYRAELELLGRDITVLEGLARPFARISYSQAVELLRGERTRQLLERERGECEARSGELAGLIEQIEADQQTVKKAWQQDKLARQLAEAREELAEVGERLANIPGHLKLAANFEWGKDLGGSDETIISRLFDGPVFVHRYPKQAKAFYMKVDGQDERVVRNFDLLAPEGFGEIIGGSQREDDLAALERRIEQEHLPREAYEWYLDLRRYGSVPHGGFGLGVERTLAWLCGLTHVRETIPFPRMMGKMYP